MRPYISMWIAAFEDNNPRSYDHHNASWCIIQSLQRNLYPIEHADPDAQSLQLRHSILPLYLSAVLACRVDAQSLSIEVALSTTSKKMVATVVGRGP